MLCIKEVVTTRLTCYKSDIQAPVAQLDRVPGFEPGCRPFESVRARQTSLNLSTPSGVFRFFVSVVKRTAPTSDLYRSGLLDI